MVISVEFRSPSLHFKAFGKLPLISKQSSCFVDSFIGSVLKEKVKICLRSEDMDDCQVSNMTKYLGYTP